jgi:CRP/FNR family transcriptional regulator
MERSQQGTQALLMTLSRELAELEDRARILLLPQSSSARLARLLLQWCVESGVNGSRAVRIDKWFTQEDIAQMIGSSRETVTRLLSTLSRRQIIQITRDCILIRNSVALNAIAES